MAGGVSRRTWWGSRAGSAFGRRLRLLVAFLVTTPTLALARPPEIRNVDLRGLRVGESTTLTIDGIELLPSPRFFLDDQVVNATVDPKSTPARVMVAIPLPPETRLGIRTLRLATAEGFSNGIAVGIDRLEQVVIAAEARSLPVGMHGSVSGSSVARTSFEGKAGEDVVIEVEARRMGSKLRPVLHLFDARRREIAWAMPASLLAGDSRILTRLPETGRYHVELHDAQYAAPAPGFFRLKIGQWEYADLTFPPAAPRGHESPLELIGRISTKSVTFKPQGNELTAPVDLTAPLASGPPPAVMVSDLPERIASDAAGNALQTLPLPPVAVSGRFIRSGEPVRFQVPVTPGSKLAFELFADRLGSRVDSILELKNSQGAILASNDDATGTVDSRIEFTIPAGLESIEASIRNALDTTGDAAIYRLAVTSVDTPPADFDVIMKTDVANIPAGESAVLELLVTRQNYDGPIQLEMTALPPGVVLQGAEIPANASGTLLTVTNQGSDVAQQVTRILAKTPDGRIVRPVRVETTGEDRTPIWLRERLALAVAPRPDSAFQVLWTDGFPAAPVLTTKTNGRWKIVRPHAMYGPVRLTLITSQNPPRVNGQLNPAFNLRLERAVEIPVNARVKAAGDALQAAEKAHLDAVAKLTAAKEEAKPAAEAAVAEAVKKKEAAETALREAEAGVVEIVEVPILFPATLTDAVCDVSVRAELLNVERNVVLRTAYAPVWRTPVVNPLGITLASNPATVAVDPKAGTVAKLTGTIDRREGYNGAVTLTVAGLPPTVAANPVAIPADKREFQIDVRIPAGFAGKEFTAQLTATGPGDPLAGNQPLKKGPVDARIVLTSPAEPAK